MNSHPSSEQYIKENISIERLIDAGVIKKHMTIEQIEKEICNYFKLKSIYEYENLFPY